MIVHILSKLSSVDNSMNNQSLLNEDDYNSNLIPIEEIDSQDQEVVNDFEKHSN